jgi:hypothetical protein
LQASAELRRELETTDQRVQDISLVLQQQIPVDFGARGPQSVTRPAMSVARAS